MHCVNYLVRAVCSCLRRYVCLLLSNSLCSWICMSSLTSWFDQKLSKDYSYNWLRTIPTHTPAVHQRHRQDRQTDGRTTYDSNTALALRASRGKNEIVDLFDRYCSSNHWQNAVRGTEHLPRWVFDDLPMEYCRQWNTGPCGWRQTIQSTSAQ